METVTIGIYNGWRWIR